MQQNRLKARQVKNLSDPTGLKTQKQLYSEKIRLYVTSLFERYEHQFELLEYIVRDVEGILIQILSEQCTSSYLSGMRYAERYTGEKFDMRKIDYKIKFSCLERELAELSNILNGLKTSLKRVNEKYNDTAYFDFEEIGRIKRMYLKRFDDLIDSEISKTFIKCLRAQYGKAGYTHKKVVSRSNACEECLKRNGMVVELNSTFDGKTVPFHPHCDCTILPEV